MFFAHGSSHRPRPTRRPQRVRLSLEPLEDRRTPSVLTHTAPTGNGPDIIRVLLTADGKNVEIYDNGKRVAQRSLSKVDSVVITGAAGESDTLIIESRAGAFFPRPVSFDGKAGSGDAVVADANADLTLTGAGITSSDGGSVTLAGAEAVELRGGAGNNTLNVSGFAGTVALLGAAGNDTYVLVPGSAVTVNDIDGDITLDFRNSPQAITATIGTTSTTVNYAGGGVVQVTGQVTTVYGTTAGDTYIDLTTIELLTIVDPDGNDTYRLDQGSTIGITDTGGRDEIVSTGTQPVTATIGTAETTVTDVDGAVVFTGTLEGITGTVLGDIYIDLTAIELLSITDPGGDDTYRLDQGSTIGITDAGGRDEIVSTGTQPITATIGTDSTTVTDADGAVVFTGTLEGITGTVLGDIYIDLTAIELLSITDPGGDDTYRLDQGSTIGITDAGGRDEIVSTGTQPITATIGTDSTTVTDADGAVVFTGTLEGVTGTVLGDIYIDLTAVELLTITDPGGNDVYDLDPGSKIVINETTGTDDIRFNRSNGSIQGNMTTGKFTESSGGATSEVEVTGGLVENYAGAPGGNNVVGNAAANVFVLGSGDDVVDGGAGDDTYIIVPDGRDVIFDASGKDTLDLSGALAGVKVDLSRTNGSAQNVDTLGNQIALNGVIENCIGSQFADVLTGGSGDDLLAGMGGDDRLLGQSGNDILVGGDGDDELNGGSDHDIVIGGRGADRINAGSGSDILIAGFTIYDTVGGVDVINVSALTAIRGEWVTPQPYATRVTNIRNGTGSLAGTGFRLTATGPGGTVTNDDGAVDTLTGGQQQDWYFIQETGPFADVVTDKNNGEVINDNPV